MSVATASEKDHKSDPHVATNRMTVDGNGMGQQNYVTGNHNIFSNVTGNHNTFNSIHEHDIEAERNKECLTALFNTDIQEDKTRIEQTKGELLKDCYGWVLKSEEFEGFLNERLSKLLWIKGNPGQGKTMLLCGIIDELVNQSSQLSTSLTYFFCQATGGDPFNNAISVMRSLIWDLCRQYPQLTKLVRQKYDNKKSNELFTQTNAWETLSSVATAMLEDPILKDIIIVIDALDECTHGLVELLRFIVRSSEARWIVSSRNWDQIEEELRRLDQKMILDLEHNSSSVSHAVDYYIDWRVDDLDKMKDYRDDLSSMIRNYLKSNAGNTFLWVALVCKQLEVEATRLDTADMVKKFPPTLSEFYERMIDHIKEFTSHPDLCKQILSIACIVYRPLSWGEISVLTQSTIDKTDASLVLRSCGSFLTMKDDGEEIAFIHLTAKEFLSENDKIFPNGAQLQHYDIFQRSLDKLSVTLTRDMSEEFPFPRRGRLASIRYSCVHWIDHLLEFGKSKQQITQTTDLEKSDGPQITVNEVNRTLHWLMNLTELALSSLIAICLLFYDFVFPNLTARYLNEALKDGGSVQRFMEEKFLHWLEALSLLSEIPHGIKSIQGLESFLKQMQAEALHEFVQDARRFILSNKRGIELAPSQTYTSALLFSPTNSLVRKLFHKESPTWVELPPKVDSYWNACLQTLEGHSSTVTSVAISNDGRKIVSGSYDESVKLWDAESGACLSSFMGHSEVVQSVAISSDGRMVASASSNTIKLWDAESGHPIRNLNNTISPDFVVFSSDDEMVVGADVFEVKLWNTRLGACVQTLTGHKLGVTSVAISADGRIVVSGSYDQTVKVWDAGKGICTRTLAGHDENVRSVAISNDGRKIVSGSVDKTVKLWDAESGACIRTLNDHSDPVSSVAISNDSRMVVSGSHDNTVKLWNTESGACLCTFGGHHYNIRSVAISNDGRTVVSGSSDDTIKLWDTDLSTPAQTPEARSFEIFTSVAISSDGQRIASSSLDQTLKLWDVESGTCIRTLADCKDNVYFMAISSNGCSVLTLSDEKTVSFWDTELNACLPKLESYVSLFDLFESVAISGDGCILAAGSRDGKVILWDAKSGTIVQKLEGEDGCSYSLAMSPDGQTIVSGSSEGTIELWDVASNKCLQRLEGHAKRINSVAISIDSSKIASGSEDETVKLWSTKSGACIQMIGVGRDIKHLSFDPGHCSHLFSDTGFILDDSTSADSTSSTQLTLSSNYSYHRYGISADGAWIVQDGDDLIWLPPEYRPAESRVIGSTVVIASQSGRLWIIRFAKKGKESGGTTQ